MIQFLKPFAVFVVGQQVVWLDLHFAVLVVSNHWTGLWTGLLDWTDGLDYWMTFELKLYAPHGFHPIRVADLVTLL